MLGYREDGQIPFQGCCKYYRHYKFGTVSKQDTLFDGFDGSYGLKSADYDDY